MKEDILCYYCTKCRQPCNDNRCCNRYCWVYRGHQTVEPNTEFVPRDSIPVTKNDKLRFFCIGCNTSVDQAKCPKHKCNTRKRHGKFYVSQTTWTQLNNSTSISPVEKRDAARKCSKFLCKIPPQAVIIRTRICQVCLSFTGDEIHCNRYTKVIFGDWLLPDTSYFPREALTEMIYGGEYYCEKCDKYVAFDLCDCGSRPSHRWYQNPSGCGYIERSAYNDYHSIVKLESRQAELIQKTLVRLVS